jgi:hypothetical protein
LVLGLCLVWIHGYVAGLRSGFCSDEPVADVELAELSEVAVVTVPFA